MPSLRPALAGLILLLVAGCEARSPQPRPTAPSAAGIQISGEARVGVVWGG